jgi:hypothetical protein
MNLKKHEKNISIRLYIIALCSMRFHKTPQQAFE